MVRFVKGQDEFNALRFVLRAREAKDKTKPAFMGLYSDGENVVCSDSRRLNYAPLKMEAGLFEVIKNSSSEIILGEQIDGQFPNYKRVIPCLDGIEPIKLNHWSGVYGAGASSAHYQLALAGVCVNYGYLEDAIKDAIKDTEERLTYVTGAESPVVIKTDLGTAIIMPINIKQKATE